MTLKCPFKCLKNDKMYDDSLYAGSIFHFQNAWKLTYMDVQFKNNFRGNTPGPPALESMEDVNSLHPLRWNLGCGPESGIVFLCRPALMCAMFGREFHDCQRIKITKIGGLGQLKGERRLLFFFKLKFNYLLVFYYLRQLCGLNV